MYSRALLELGVEIGAGVLLVEPGLRGGVLDVVIGVCERPVGVFARATGAGPFCHEVLPFAGCLFAVEGGELDLVDAALVLEGLYLFTERGRREWGDVGCDGGVVWSWRRRTGTCCGRGTSLCARPWAFVTFTCCRGVSLPGWVSGSTRYQWVGEPGSRPSGSDKLL